MTASAMVAPSFDYSAAPVPVRPDILEAHARTWEWLRNPGSWWTGAERVEIAAETRNALDCPLCHERKTALSPFSVDGEHSHTAKVLPAPAIDAVHRIITDATRLSQDWVNKLATQGVSDAHYIELVGIVVSVLSIDELHRGLGIDLLPLPEPAPGKPSHDRPSGLASGTAWVPMITLEGSKNTPNEDLFDGLPIAPNVIAALSLVPEGVRRLQDLSEAYYVPTHEVANPTFQGRALNRSQIELIAGRVSALNECFY